MAQGAVTIIARPAFTHAERIYREFTQKRDSAESAFGEACLELLRINYDTSRLKTSFEAHLIDLGPFDMHLFTPTKSEHEIWCELFGDTEEGTLATLKRVLDDVLRRNGVNVEIRGFLEDDDSDAMAEEVYFYPHRW